jgi:hypothetical protein
VQLKKGKFFVWAEFLSDQRARVRFKEVVSLHEEFRKS